MTTIIINFCLIHDIPIVNCSNKYTDNYGITWDCVNTGCPLCDNFTSIDKLDLLSKWFWNCEGCQINFLDSDIDEILDSSSEVSDTN